MRGKEMATGNRIYAYVEVGRSMKAQAEAAAGTVALLDDLYAKIQAAYPKNEHLGGQVAQLVLDAAVDAANAKADELLAASFGAAVPPVPAVQESTS